MNGNYTEPRQFSAQLRGQNITYLSKPGLPGWEQVSPASKLLADHVELPAQGKALLLGCGHGALAAVLARAYPGCTLWLLDSSHTALQMSARTLAANQIHQARLHAEISVLPSGEAGFDAAILDLPRGRKLAQRWLAEAYAALRPDGLLFLGGAKNQGVRPAIQDAEALFGKASVLGYKKGSRVVRLVKDPAFRSQADWARLPGIAPGTWEQIDIHTPQGQFHLYSLPGIFSYDRLDAGTRLLLDYLRVSPGERVLDLGCGYGIIGLCAATAGAGHVDLLDDNLLAVAAARRNVQNCAFSQAQVHASDVFSAVQGQTYNAIFSNPPFHAGREVDNQISAAFIEQSHTALVAGGRLTLVANQFLRYERLLAQRFGRVERLGMDGRYQVWQAIK
jgi:16S rRNA (guanine1207-N2)-methyltransferase